ncbi:helix-turn-helix domain-containing protein [Streptomyces griseorubiginosus]|uniref:helix-turn-helix domain-containing protein n=1 Tax=Streptomyces griseorubiginosus TaxID=67304 RepID=UPI0036E0E686
MNARSAKGLKAERDALRQRMTDLGCPVAAIAQEMRAQFGFRPREAWRHAHGWSLQEVADRINARRAGDVSAADAPMISKHEKWPHGSSRRLTVPALCALADVYECTIDDLLDMEDRRTLPRADLDLLNRLGPVEPSGTQLVLQAADESLTFAQWAETSNVGPISLAELLRRAQSLATEYLRPESKPLDLFAHARAQRNKVFALLEGHQHPHQTSELYLVGGYLCGLLAWISSDLGHPEEAEAQVLTAWLCAELSGNDTLRAWILSVRSKTAFWDGRLRDAVNHARRGASYHSSGTVSALLACQEADAWSQLGAADEALAALGRAETARDTANTPDEIGGLFSCGPARQENYHAAVRLRLGQPTQALLAADRGLDLLRAQHVRAYGTLAQIHISRATALVAAGEPEGAYEALGPVFALSPDRRLAPVSNRLNELAAGLNRTGGRSAVGLRTAIEDFRLNSAPRQLALSPGSRMP